MARGTGLRYYYYYYAAFYSPCVGHKDGESQATNGKPTGQSGRIAAGSGRSTRGISFVRKRAQTRWEITPFFNCLISAKHCCQKRLKSQSHFDDTGRKRFLPVASTSGWIRAVIEIRGEMVDGIQGQWGLHIVPNVLVDARIHCFAMSCDLHLLARTVEASRGIE